MARELLRGKAVQTTIPLDPRTKILLVLTVSTILLSGGNGGIMNVVKPIIAAMPLLLLLFSRNVKMAGVYLVVYGLAFAAEIYLVPLTQGALNFLILATCGILSRFMPGLMMGYFLFSTTTVSEFVAAMERMHVSQKIVIPLSVMFRFFPTVGEEYVAIADAMRMRGIRLGGGNPAAMMEYRLVPLLMCSVKIGEELSASALTRGLGAPVQRTNICVIGFHVQDMVAIAICVTSLGVFGLRVLGVLQ